jgi:hypothetical protein
VGKGAFLRSLAEGGSSPSAVPSRHPPPPINDPPQMRYSPAGVLLKAQIKGELRVPLIPVRSLHVSGTKPVVKRVDAVLSLHVYRRGLRSVFVVGLPLKFIKH